MDESRQKNLAVIGLVIVSLGWAGTFVVIKNTLDLVPPFALCMLRFIPAAALLALIYRRKLVHATFDDIKNGVIIGFFLFICFVADVLAFKFTLASKLAFISGLYVVFVPFMAWYFNKIKPDKFSAIGVTMAIVGLALLTIRRGIPVSTGDMLALLTALLLGAHIIAIEHFGKGRDPILMTIIQFIVTAVLFVPMTLIFESFRFSMLENSWPQLSFLSLFATLIGLLVQNVAQKYISSTSTAMILLLSTIFGSAASIYFLNEYLSAIMLVGGVISILAVVIQITKLNFLRRKPAGQTVSTGQTGTVNQTDHASPIK